MKRGKFNAGELVEAMLRSAKVLNEASAAVSSALEAKPSIM